MATDVWTQDRSHPPDSGARTRRTTAAGRWSASVCVVMLRRRRVYKLRIYWVGLLDAITVTGMSR